MNSEEFKSIWLPLSGRFYRVAFYILESQEDAEDAVHCAVVLEVVAQMAKQTESINPKVEPTPQHLMDKHYYRKHGENAYYGQGPA